MMYPSPSILMVTDSFPQTRGLKQKLENNGCQVYWTDTSTTGLVTACQKYFDLIVLNLGVSGVDHVEVCRKLKARPELARIPVVMLTTCDYANEATSSLESYAPVYCLVKETLCETKLLQIIEQTHYLTYRYL